jgi:hypothetical protein
MKTMKTKIIPAFLLAKDRSARKKVNRDEADDGEMKTHRNY